jgi:hypothetical protein
LFGEHRSGRCSFSHVGPGIECRVLVTKHNKMNKSANKQSISCVANYWKNPLSDEKKIAPFVNTVLK